ncbi:MAG: NAD-dependent succinate-semialdehyde dehydrogenase [Pseudomonadota bacterium]
MTIGSNEAGGAALLASVKEARLVRTASYIDGAWAASSDVGVDIECPASNTVIAQVAKASAADADKAIIAAKRAFPAWRALLAKERGAILRRWADLMTAHKEDLSLIMTAEQGKPLEEARGEIDYAAGFLTWFAAEAERIDGEVLAPHKPDRRMLVLREPIGVTAAVTPWNFPSAMITRKAGAALAAGCSMVVRPASETPLSALALAELAEEAGVPAGVFSVIVGDGRELGGALTDSPDVKAISFTGSTEVGRILIRQSAETVKKVSMELGGHAPFIAFDDCDLDKTVADAVVAKFTTTGQDCLAANRIFVQRSIYDAFCEKFAAAAKAMKVGPGWEDGVEQGPLMNKAAVEKCAAHVDDAVTKGGRLLAGGGADFGPNFFAPTVIVDATPEMAIFREETFGPVAAIFPFDTEEEVVALANDTHYGLASYLYTNDMRRIWRVGEALEYGMVGVNTPSFTGPPIPFGGHKQSGLGREGGHYSLEDYMETKYICMDVA